MTGREAITTVRLMSVEERRRCLGHQNATLACVVAWTFDDPDGWRALLAQLGLVEPTPGQALMRLIAVWRAELLTIEEASARAGVPRSTTKTYFRTHLRGARWESEMAESRRKRYRLIDMPAGVAA